MISKVKQADKKSDKLVGKQKLINDSSNRVLTYSLLKRFFIEEPNKVFVDLLINEDLLAVIPYQGRNKRLREGVELISLFLKDPELYSRSIFGDLLAEYNYLFGAAGKKMPSPPYESIYLTGERRVFQQEMVDVRVEFAKQGLLPKNYQLEPDDHIYLELDFMAILGERSIEALRKNDWAAAKKAIQAQKSFLNEHLLKWVPQFSKDIINGARSGFFEGVAKVLVGYLIEEKSEIDDLLKQINKRAKLDKEAAAV